MRSRSGNGANRLDQRPNLRFVHPGPGGIKKPALGRTAWHSAARVHSFNAHPNEIDHLNRLDPSPGDHLQSGLNGLFDRGKTLCGLSSPPTGQNRSDSGRPQLSACLGVMDCLIQRSVEHDLINAHSSVQRREQVEVYSPVGEQSPAHHLVHAEGQDRFSLRHDGLPLDGRVHEIPFARADEHPEAEFILLGRPKSLNDEGTPWCQPAG